ncbi:MAG: hypothetical protein KGI06_06200 [Candidatus Micrarchaeota archaeon]|nr:hypothetical protein [Candidatus Micrarchaeota archaeon]
MAETEAYYDPRDDELSDAERDLVSIAQGVLQGQAGIRFLRHLKEEKRRLEKEK